MRPKRGEEKLIFQDETQRLAMAARLHKLYVVERRTTPEIAVIVGVATHKSVLRAMNVYGIPRRKVGQSRAVTCIEPGCHLPVYKIRHATNCSWYPPHC